MLGWEIKPFHISNLSNWQTFLKVQMASDKIKSVDLRLLKPQKNLTWTNEHSQLDKNCFYEL